MSGDLVALRPVRQWIRRTQAAHRDGGESFGTAYTVVFCLAVLAAMFHEPLANVFSPLAPRLSGSGALAAGAVCTGLLLLALRRLGPVTVSRPAAYFLLTAPVSRRRLLAPAMRTATAGAALAAGLATLAILGNAVASGSYLLVGAGALVGVLLTLLAAAARARPRLAALTDTVARLALAAGLAVLVAEATGWTPPLPGGTIASSAVVTLTGALAVLAAIAFPLGVRDLARTPDREILDVAKATGTLADAIYGMEPSFLADMVERRYWARRRLRSARLPRRLPPLTGQDVLLARRRPARLVWTAASTTLPLLLLSAPRWALVIVLLAGSTLAARATTGTVKTDAGNPVLLRMLGRTARQVVQQRFWVPLALATLWATTALTLLQLAGGLPAGQWWPLGLALGPVGAAAAIRAARTGFVRNDLLPFETPMGALPTGALVYAFAGVDLMILLLPTVLGLAQGVPLTWPTAVFQIILAVAGVRAYLAVSTGSDRVELARRG